MHDDKMMARMLLQVLGAFPNGLSGITINVAARFNVGKMGIF